MSLAKMKELLANSKPMIDLVALFQQERVVSAIHTTISSRALITDIIFQNFATQILCLFPEEQEAKQFYDDFVESNPGTKTNLFLAHGRQAWTELGPLSEQVGRRILTLKSLMSKEPQVIVCSAASLLEKVAHPATLKKLLLQLNVDEDCDFEALIEHLVRIGYVREERVDRPGEVAVRGGLIDLFLFEEINPIRIEFYGDRIDSIREFDVETQRSLEQRTAIEILPPSSAGPYGPYLDQPIDALALETNLLDWLAENTPLLISDKSLLLNSLDDGEKDASVRFETFVQEHSLQDEFDFAAYYASATRIYEKINTLKQIIYNGLGFDSAGPAVDFGMERNMHFAGNLKLFRQEIESLMAKDNASAPFICILCDNDAQTERIRDLLSQEQFPPSVETFTLNLSEGFAWPAYQAYFFTNREIYSRVRFRKHDRLSNRKISINEMLKLKEGDYVVHTDYGVGIFRGLQTIKAYGKSRECIRIEYQGEDQLYVPLEKMDRVQKYSSREGHVPVLSKLGTKEWEKLKKRTKDRLKEVAEKLIKLYALRKMKAGHPFPSDTIWQKELEASFQYEETVDQLTAIADIKRDMEKAIPMDRLVCGDVGFGKTEVAVRAAFKALNDGRQVAVLVPTTVLAQQHFQTFQERLRNYPVKIDVLSRFKSPARQKEIVQRMLAGQVDLVIGTHRLLSKDVQFKNLGLLVVDEEHKFGVMHKERLKLLKSQVDTLTLSATPIPRTMHMALMGARDMSLINTPPGNRVPIKTEVCRFDREYIREVILREVDRGGQVFFLHNRVQTIHAIHHLLKEILPEINFAVAHGQMDAHELEKIMMDFSESRIQCLICTMIIESGIDVPNANTLIVNRADRFGLAQLYQLRGRVGRSDQQAYAFFLIPALKKLNRNAIKRLQTIQEYTHLGSGYKIAMRDLEIRGTGNIFGAEQSGFVEALGYELYAKIIEDAIKELRNELKLDAPATQEPEHPELETRVELNQDAFLPSDYVNSPADRVDIYKRLIEAKDLDQVADIDHEIQDRFGPLPIQARMLLDFISLKILTRNAAVEMLSFQNGKIVGKFHASAIPKGEHFRPWIGKILQNAGPELELKQKGEELLFQLDMSKNYNPIETTKKFLQSIV